MCREKREYCMAQVKCSTCGTALEVKGFGGAIKCPNCSGYTPYAPEKRVRCPHCNKLTTIQDVRGMEFKCAFCHKALYYTKSGDIVANISGATIAIVNTAGVLGAVAAGIAARNNCVCGSVLLVLAALDVYFFSVRNYNKPLVTLEVIPVAKPAENQIAVRMPILVFIAYVANADGELNPREQEFIRWLVDAILRSVPNITEAQVQQDLIAALQFIRDYTPPPFEKILDLANALRPNITFKIASDLLDILCELGTVDGEFGPEERQIVKRIAVAVGMPEQTVDRVIAQYITQGQSRSTPEAQREITMREAYAILGLSPDATFEKVKERFKELAKRYHPDLQAGKSEADKIHAEEMMKLITTAYQRIETQRRQ